MIDSAFSADADKSRARAREAAKSMGATAIFVMVNTGGVAGLAEQVEARQGQSENLVFLTGEALKAWMPVLAGRPRLYTAPP